MKQSSIEWLMEIDKSRAITIEEWQQAKAMHKEEIFKSYEEGYRAAQKNIDPSCKCGLPKYGGYTCSRTDCDQNL